MSKKNSYKKTTIQILSNVLSIDDSYFIKYNDKGVPKLAEIINTSSNKTEPYNKDLNKDYDFNYWTDTLTKLHKEKQKHQIYIKDSQQYIEDNNIKSTKINKFFKDFNFKSGIFLASFDNDKLNNLFILKFHEKSRDIKGNEKFIDRTYATSSKTS